MLVNNAALTYYLPIKDFPLNKWMRSWAVNFHAPFILSQLVLGEMIPRRTGAIVNISSGAAIGPGRGPYPDAARRRGAAPATARRRPRWSASRQGLAAEVYPHGVSVTCVSPSQVVPTPGTVYHRLVSSLDDPRGEPPELMAQAALLLATEPLDQVTGRVTYSQQILKEFGWIDEVAAAASRRAAAATRRFSFMGGLERAPQAPRAPRPGKPGLLRERDSQPAPEAPRAPRPGKPGLLRERDSEPAPQAPQGGSGRPGEAVAPLDTPRDFLDTPTDTARRRAARHARGHRCSRSAPCCHSSASCSSLVGCIVSVTSFIGLIAG